MASWTDSTLSTNVKNKAVHINELKNTIQTLINNANLTSSISIGTITTTGKILDDNISSLQKAVNALETSFSNNCAKSQCSDKCETCQDTCTCQSCQSSKCQACEKCQDSCTCQSCQTSKCQSCQSQCDCNCNCDCWDCDCGDDYGS